MIKTLLWDIDGTLLNFLKAEEYAIRKCFQIFNLPECTDEMLAEYSSINKKYWEELEKGNITKQQVLRGRFEEFFKRENIKFDRIDELNSEYQLRLGDNIYFSDNAMETVTYLKGKCRQYAVTNGTFKAQERKLNRSGLIDVFDDVFISDQIGYEKPSVEFFNEVQKKTGLFKKEETMIIGDSLSSDMRGGNNIGIICCWYNPLGEENKSGAKIHHEIKNIKEVIKLAEG